MSELVNDDRKNIKEWYVDEIEEWTEEDVGFVEEFMGVSDEE